jgi:hypothetical protein
VRQIVDPVAAEVTALDAAATLETVVVQVAALAAAGMTTATRARATIMQGASTARRRDRDDLEELEA